jgi:hypothetical protein
MIGRFVDGVGTLIVSGTKSASSVHPRNLRCLTESLRRMGSGGAFFWCLNRGVHPRPTNAGHECPAFVHVREPCTIVCPGHCSFVRLPALVSIPWFSGGRADRMSGMSDRF